MSNVIGDITLGQRINDIVVSGFGVVPGYGVSSVTLIAHPSNTGVVYIRQRNAASGLGFPLGAGERLQLDGVDLYQYTASGVAGQRLAWSANR